MPGAVRPLQHASPDQPDREYLRRRSWDESAGRCRRRFSESGELPKGANLDIRGQIPPMQQMFQGLGIGLAVGRGGDLPVAGGKFSIDAAGAGDGFDVPAVIAGVCVALCVTGTTLNIQSFIGAIMAVGVAMANAICWSRLPNTSPSRGSQPVDAALEGAGGRVRPIVMTSLAMIAGMVPLALAIGEGSEQSAPLGGLSSAD